MRDEAKRLRARAEAHGQDHVFRWWRTLSQAGRRRLLAQVRAIGFELLDALIERHVARAGAGPRLGKLMPAEPVPLTASVRGLPVRKTAWSMSRMSFRIPRNWPSRCPMQA